MKGRRTESLDRTNPRQLRYLLTFERNLTPRDASGGAGPWTPDVVCIVKGSIEPLEQQGGEYSRADWTVGIDQYKVKIYRRSDIRASMRIVYNQRYFQILQAPQVSRADRFQMIFCQEIFQ